VITPKTDPFRVLQLTSTSDLGGAERMVLWLSQALDRTEFQPHIASLIGSGALHELAKQSDIPGTDLRFRSVVDPGGISRLVRLLHRERIDIIQTHGLRADAIARWAARLAGTRIVISTIHSIDPWRRWHHTLIDRATAPLVTHYIAVCEAAKQAAIAREHIPENRITVIPIGLPPRPVPRSDRDALRARFEIPSDAFPVVGVLANLREMKGHLHAIDALPAILKQLPRAMFIFAGRDDSHGEIERYARERGVQPAIRFPGFIDRSEDVLGALDLFLQPSDWEGLPVSVLEALHTPLPIIATRVGGIPEIIRDGVEGVLIAPRDPSAIARAVINLANDPARRARFCKAAESRALTTFSLSHMTLRTEELYLKLLGKSA
jgi:glycosyltransferase involved in cell wall biosynthesis